MSAKLLRQNRIKDILNSVTVSSHEELVKILSDEGYQVTQATLSRDFAELGVIRTISDNGIKYILNSLESGKQISKLISFEILYVQSNESMVIVRTLAGRAQGVAYHIDRLNLPEIMGTVGGDDTVLIIPSSHAHIVKIVSLVKDIMLNQTNKSKD
ncbi:MAG: arginine repressor [bacterium]